MNQQDMQDRRVRGRTDYQAPVQTPYDAEEDEYDDVYPPRMPTSARRYTSIPTQHPRKRVINVYDVAPGIPPRRSRSTTQSYVAPFVAKCKILLPTCDECQKPLMRISIKECTTAHIFINTMVLHHL